MKERKYFEPETIDEACRLLREYGSDAKVVAGGQGIMYLLARRMIRPECLISIHRIRELDKIALDDGRIVIGALTTHRTIETSSTIERNCPVLAETASRVADIQIRNVGTLGGNLCEAHPASDPPAVLISLGAQARLVSWRGSRSLALGDFFKDAFATAIEPDELLVEISLPRPSSKTGSAYVKFSLRESDFATAGAAATVTLDDSGACKDASLVFAAIWRTPVSAPQAAKLLVGSQLDDAAIAQAAEAAASEVEIGRDALFSADYKRHLVGVLSRYALKQAALRAQNQ